jgi:hypothetical protein
MASKRGARLRAHNMGRFVHQLLGRSGYQLVLQLSRKLVIQCDDEPTAIALEQLADTLSINHKRIFDGAVSGHRPLIRFWS